VIHQICGEMKVETEVRI